MPPPPHRTPHTYLRDSMCSGRGGVGSTEHALSQFARRPDSRQKLPLRARPAYLFPRGPPNRKSPQMSPLDGARLPTSPLSLSLSLSRLPYILNHPNPSLLLPRSRPRASHCALAPARPVLRAPSHLPSSMSSACAPGAIRLPAEGAAWPRHPAFVSMPSAHIACLHWIELQRGY